MARGKTTRANSSANARRQTKIKVDVHDASNRTMEERLEAIEYHWRSFSPMTKKFLLSNPKELTLQKLVNFWTLPDQIHCAQMAVSIGTSHLLAYEYFNIQAFENARALALNGAFLQQCSSTPIEKIKAMPIEECTPESLPFFHAGVRACVSSENIAKYLKRVLPLKYQKLMGFESHSNHRPGMGYVDLISNDWNTTSQGGKHQHNETENDGPHITIILCNEDEGINNEKSICATKTLKSLFNEYADECGASLRSLRFSFNGSTLFLSSVGHKTPTDLGMKHQDIIKVSSTTSVKTDEAPKPAAVPSKANKKKSKTSSKKGKGKQTKRTSSGSQVISIPENDRGNHSLRLSKVFEEADPKFKEIRRRLNELMLDCQVPKVKRMSSRKKSDETSSAVFNPLSEGLGGKAGRTSFVVNVGSVENLYKTSKRNSTINSASRPSCTAKIDLHGCTKDEALELLDKSLNEWVDTAMLGSYPWVIPAVIVCGGGNQVLSETVEAWIRENKNVANAPKSSVF